MFKHGGQAGHSSFPLDHVGIHGPLITQVTLLEGQAGWELVAHRLAELVVRRGHGPRLRLVVDESVGAYVGELAESLSVHADFDGGGLVVAVFAADGLEGRFVDISVQGWRHEDWVALLRHVQDGLIFE